MELLPLQVKEQCESLNNKEKQELYRQVIKEAKNAAENSNIDQLKKLSEVAVVIEKASEKELFKSFDDKNPLREVNIIIESDGLTNYLFSFGDSSKLYDLRENKKETLYQAVQSNDVELVKQLLIVLLPEEMSKVDIKDLVVLLLKACEELNLSQDMNNYLEKKIGFYNFLYDFESSKDLIELFANWLEVNYEIDKFLLSIIVVRIKEGELFSEVNNMIELLKKHERFDELKYKIRRLKSEVESGKSKYITEIIQSSIEEREKEMCEIEEKYIKPIDLVQERKRLVKQLCFKRFQPS